MQGNYTHFVELANRSEGFKAEAFSDDDIVHFADLINQPSSVQGSVQGSDYLSLSVETQTLSNQTTSKNIARVVLVNEKGERVLDTLVKP